MKRWLLFFCGWLAFVLGIVGIFLPVLPTAPFLLLAAVCWARSSERFYRWLVYHPQLGTPIREWMETKSLPLRTKFLAIAMIAVSMGASMLFFVKAPLGRMAMTFTGIAVALYLSLGIPTRRRD